MPMAILLLSTFYRRLPDTLGDAAMIDGAGHFTLFWRIYTPLIKPAVATVVVLNIGPAWNDFFFPLIMQRTQSLFTLPVGITAFFSEFSVDRGLLFAGLVLAAAPLAIVFALSMRFVVGGLTAGMEK
jgi:raffinose/stachyose/melibiose transport system permease protein